MAQATSGSARPSASTSIPRPPRVRARGRPGPPGKADPPHHVPLPMQPGPRTLRVMTGRMGHPLTSRQPLHMNPQTLQTWLVWWPGSVSSWRPCRPLSSSTGGLQVVEVTWSEHWCSRLHTAHAGRGFPAALCPPLRSSQARAASFQACSSLLHSRCRILPGVKLRDTGGTHNMQLCKCRGRAERGASEAAAAATRSQQERERLLEQVEELSGQLQRSRWARDSWMGFPLRLDMTVLQGPA